MSSAVDATVFAVKARSTNPRNRLCLGGSSASIESDSLACHSVRCAGHCGGTSA